MPSEFELIDIFLKPFGGGEGVGSDCAAVKVTRGMQLVATTDAVVQGVHFTLPRFSPEDVGWKALAVNLSDLAAAGAKPRWFLCALGVPPRTARLAERIARGMAKLATSSGCKLVGGNVTRSSEWSITITALGEARRPLTRFGARPGDALVVAGKLGDAAAPGAPKAQRRPVPLVDAGMKAGPFASASIDVSDGFVQDLGHLCDASGVGAVVECSALPLGPAARALPHGMELALSGGEDYALIWSVPRARVAALQRVVKCVEVGRITRAPGIQLTELGVPRPLPARRGFDHLR
ncbi:MAG: thiamine-phosphate kinase [Deltaproteobacteria bacterium]|nr:MAG: thiamine-phosphate kinase [Deltaproteobacteria bacterium]